MKRFTDTEKWIKDKWFSELEPKYKLFWLYLIDNCDNVGVWEVNLRIANMLIGYEYSIDSLLVVFEDKVHVMHDGNKWWVTSFIQFQHGKLDPESSSKPVLSYFALLEKHRLSIDYTNTIHSVQGKGKGKGKGKGSDNELYTEDFSEWWKCYKTGSKAQAFKAWKKQGMHSLDLDELISKTEQYKNYCVSVERSYKDGQGWINGRFFETEWTHEAQGTKTVNADEEDKYEGVNFD